MNEEIKSQISAFVDGELPAAEADLLTRRLGEDPELRQQAATYFEIGRLLRGERSVSGLDDLRGNIAAAVDGETFADAVGIDANGGRWVKPMAGVAIAASVAVLALVGLRQLDLPSADGLQAEATLAADDVAGYTEPLAIDVMADRPSDRLMQYYLRHGETSGELGANGILSRLVTLELRGGELVEVSPAVDAELAAPPADEDTSTDDVQEQ